MFRFARVRLITLAAWATLWVPTLAQADRLGELTPAAPGSVAAPLAFNAGPLGVLDVVTSSVAAGDDTAYLVIDFAATGGGAYAWQYQFDADANLTSFDMQNDIITQANPTWTITFSNAFGYFVNNINLPDFGESGDESLFWQFFTGAPTTQTIDWSSSFVGISTNPLTDGAVEGWYNGFDEGVRPRVPVIPTPATGLLVLAGAGWLLARRRRQIPARRLGGAAIVLAAVAITIGAAPSHASPYAVEVISYVGGTGGGDAFKTDGAQTLGAPSREAGFGSQVGVFYAPFLPTDLATIGDGGEIIVKMGTAVEDDPLNPFGIDLLIHGNAFYVATSGGVFAEPMPIQVSSDGDAWFDVIGVFADDAYPTLGYTDTVYDGFGNSGGTIETDWRLPVDPAFTYDGSQTEAQINAAYNGSGGGTGIDLANDLSASDYDQLLLDPISGLPYIQYVRVYSTGNVGEVQAFVDVAAIPEPATLMLVALGGGLLLWRSPS